MVAAQIWSRHHLLSLRADSTLGRPYSETGVGLGRAIHPGWLYRILSCCAPRTPWTNSSVFIASCRTLAWR